MPARTNKEIFLMLLSHVRQGTEKGAKIYQEFGQVAQHPQIQEALEAPAFVAQGVLAKIDQCFKILGEEPVEPSGHLQEVFLEDFRQELHGQLPMSQATMELVSGWKAVSPTKSPSPRERAA